MSQNRYGIVMMNKISIIFLSLIIVGCQKANFQKLPFYKKETINSYSVVIHKNSNEGIITSSFASFNCGLTCTSINQTIPKTSNLTIDFTPNEGYFIRGWTGCDLIVNNNRTCVINNLALNKSIHPLVSPILYRACAMINGVGKEASLDNGSTW